MGRIEHQPAVQLTGFEAKIQRKEFLRYTGAAVVAVAGLASCTRDYPISDVNNPFTNTDYTIDFGNAQDAGYFNYLYALEQLEAAFYVQLATAFPAGLTLLQTDYLQDIRRHELVHREFFKSFLGTSGIGALSFNFSSVDFTSLTAVLTTAKTFEDLGVAAYNGVIAGCKKSETVILASQIASVEARHAAWIRNQITPNSFADLADLAAVGAVAAEGKDAFLSPAKVLEAASKYITTKLNVVNL